MSDNDIMSQVQSIMEEAASQLKEEKKRESVLLTEQMVTEIHQEFSVSGDNVLFFMIKEIPIGEVDIDHALNSEQVKGKALDKAEAEGWTGGSVSTPYTFDSRSQAIADLDNKVGAMIADLGAEGRSWATLTAHKHQATTIYMLVGGGSLTVTKVLPTGDKVTEYHTAPVPQDAVPDHSKELAQAQWNFTATPQILRLNYPTAYKALADKVRERMEDMGDDD